MNIEARRQLRPTDWPFLLIAALLTLLAIAVALYVITAPRAPPAQDGRYAGFARGIDDVALVNARGETVHWADLNGKPRLVFFGFTRCPEICPTTIAELSAAIDELGAAAGDLQVVFVSVDPERDTPAHLAAYFASFGPRFQPYTGQRDQIDRLVQSFRAFYEHVPVSGGDYTVNHTAITYLVNARGEVVEIIGYGAPHARTLAQLRAFVR